VRGVGLYRACLGVIVTVDFQSIFTIEIY
jgi:hypothetical protein